MYRKSSRHFKLEIERLYNINAQSLILPYFSIPVFCYDYDSFDYQSLCEFENHAFGERYNFVGSRIFF